MSSISVSTALSGMSAANERLRASGHNLANLNTEGFRRERVEAQTQPDGAGVQTQLQRVPAPGTDLEADMVEQKSATYAYVANLRVLQTQLRAEGAMLDIHV